MSITLEVLLDHVIIPGGLLDHVIETESLLRRFLVPEGAVNHTAIQLCQA
jgi:hypothetical protein